MRVVEIEGGTGSAESLLLSERPDPAVGVGQPGFQALLKTADTGRVAQGSVGAAHGTVMFGWKGGIGTSSRKLPASLGGWTVGVLVQANFGGVLQVSGAPVGRELDRYAFQNAVAALAEGRSESWAWLLTRA